jgi:integrase
MSEEYLLNDSDLASWVLTITVEGKSRGTVLNYQESVRQYRCSQGDQWSAISVKVWLASIPVPKTRAVRMSGLRSLGRWLQSEGSATDATREIHLRRPPEKLIDPVGDDVLDKLLGTCSSRSLEDLRDGVLIRLMAHSGLRACEALRLSATQIDLRQGTAVILQGKGSKQRVVFLPPQTVLALDRWLRALAKTEYADFFPSFRQPGGLGYHGLRHMVNRRASRAGVGPVRLHGFRHRWCCDLLSRGISDTSLQLLAGWDSQAMIQRYGRTVVAERALAEARALMS